MHDTAILIQARLSSSRFHSKITRPMAPGGECLLEIIYKSLQQMISRELSPATPGVEAPFISFIIPDDEPELAARLKELQLPFMTGHPTDVLQRYIVCGRMSGRHNLVRLTADNPFYDTRMLWRLINLSGESRATDQAAAQKPADYAAISSLLLGTAGEAFTLAALERQVHEFEDQLSPPDHEHVSLFLKHNPEHFKLLYRQAAEIDPAYTFTREEYAAIRLTCDYPADHHLLSEIAGRVDNVFDVRNSEIAALYREDPALFELNSQHR